MKHNLLGMVMAAALGLTVVGGCGKKDDPINQAEKKDVAKGVPAPGIAETKAIAEEGFIYGLPIVMNYAVMSLFLRAGEEVPRTTRGDYATC
jgi:hypothetical protein